MSNHKLRRQLAWEAARLMYSLEESEYFRAKAKAVRRICVSSVRPRHLPSNREIRDQIQVMARLQEQDPCPSNLADTEPVCTRESIEVSPDQNEPESESSLDRGILFELLLVPLEKVKGNRTYHPEGDALYHSLQVFKLAREHQPYDTEFLEAALLHDVGKAIDRVDPVAAGLDALAGLVTERTEWFIRHNNDAQRLRDGTLGIRARRRLRASEDFELLELFVQCDRQGRQCGVAVPHVGEAIQYIRDLEQM